MGNVISFADKALRAKVSTLVKEAEKAFDEFTEYRNKHIDALIGSPERVAGMKMHGAAAALRDEAIRLTADIEGDFMFSCRYFAMGRDCSKASNSDY